MEERSEAERIASDLQSLLSHYELALSATKTAIVELPCPLEPLWTSRLRTFHFREAGVRGERNDLTAYFDLAFDFAGKAPHENTLKFAVSRLNGVELGEENWEVFQHILGQCVINEPAALPQTCVQIAYYVSIGRELDDAFWTEVLNRIVIERLPLGQASEAVWAMWLLLMYRLPLFEAGERAVAGCEDSLAALLGLALRDAGLAGAGLLTSLNVFAEPSESDGRFWLLCYEGGRRGWITAPSGASAFSAGSSFAFMAQRNVSFFDPATLPTLPQQGYFGPTGGGDGDYDI